MFNTHNPLRVLPSLIAAVPLAAALAVVGHASPAAALTLTANPDIVAGRDAFLASGATATEFDWSSFFAQAVHVAGIVPPNVHSVSFSVDLPDATVNSVMVVPTAGAVTLNLGNWTDLPGFNGPGDVAAADLAVDGNETFRIVFGKGHQSVGLGILTGASNLPSEVDLSGAAFEFAAYDGNDTLLGMAFHELAAGAPDQVWISLTSATPFTRIDVTEVSSVKITDQYFTNILSAVEDVSDGDEDGIPDAVDVCDDSDLGDSVVVDECDSGVPNLLDESGCTIADLVAACVAEAANHGEFVRCVAHAVKQLEQEGMIVGKEAGQIKSCAAQADLP